MTIDCLPLEILEKIFHFLDGISLQRASGVCLKWRYLTNSCHILGLWKHCALTEISPEMLIDIVNGNDFLVNDESEKNAHFNNLPSTLKDSDWKQIYKTWYTTSKISVWTHHYESFATSDAIPITCCKISGSLVFTSHRNGSICAWDWKNGSLVHVVSQHLAMVTDFALFDLLREGPYGDPKNPCAHHHVVSVSRDHTIQISPIFGFDGNEANESDKLVLRHHGETLNSIRAYGNSFAVNCTDNTISVWRLLAPKMPWSKASVLKGFIIYGPEEYIYMIGFWNDKVLSLCNDVSLKVFSMDDCEWSNWPNGKNSNQSFLICQDGESADDLQSYQNIGMINAAIFRKTTIFVFTIDCYLWVSIDGCIFQRYKTMETLQSHVVSVCLRGSLLAMGLERGLLLLFHLTQPSDILNLDFRRPSWSKQLSEASIISTDILEIQSYPIVAATTSQNVYVIYFDPNNK